MADPEISRFPCKELPYMPGSMTTPGRADTRNNASFRVAFHPSRSYSSHSWDSLAGVA